MTPDQARHAILNLLKEQDKAINLDLVDALGGNEELFERVKQRLILDEEAEDFKGVGLQLSPQSSSTGSESRSGRGLPSPKLFLSYGRKDASGLARRLKDDLEQKGYEVWMDTSEVRSGSEWAEEIEDGLRSTQMVLALLSPHAVRKSTGPGEDDSVCLDEISFARFSQPPTHIIPVMAEPCEPPFVLFRLDQAPARGSVSAWERCRS